MYHPLFENLENLKFYQYIIILLDDIDKCYDNNISFNESADARYKKQEDLGKQWYFQIYYIHTIHGIWVLIELCI